MHNPLRISARALLALFIAATLPSLILTAISLDASASGPHGHGCKEGNLIPNCGMDNFGPVAQYQVPRGWTPFVVSGSLAIDGPHEDTYWNAPSARLWSDGNTFDAGLYTQVGGLTPGATYSASIGWGAPKVPEDSFGRRLGIDPFGGTDPNSPNVVWGPEWRGPGKVLNDTDPGRINIDVSAVAKALTVTVFVRVNHNYTTGQNEIFIDAVGLYQDAGAPVTVATNTPPPAAAAPAPLAVPTKPKAPAATKRPPAATPTARATRTPTPAATNTPAPTDTPSPTATSTVTSTPVDTATPSVTPTSTLPLRPRATVAPVTTQVVSTTAAPQSLLYGGIVALAGAGLLVLVVALFRRS